MANQEKPKRGRPATGQTPKRYFRMSDDDWAQIEQAAAAGGKTVSDFVRDVLTKAAARAMMAKRTKRSGATGN
jgi:uncharacterized protein (DUF1778 family)